VSGIGVKWAIRRYSPSAYSALEEGTPSLSPSGRHEQTFDEWRDVCLAADTILGDHDLKMGCVPTDPVVIQHGEDVVLIYMKLVI
jgi:hypothetical protein